MVLKKTFFGLPMGERDRIVFVFTILILSSHNFWKKFNLKHFIGD